MIWVAKNLYFFNCLLDGAHTIILRWHTQMGFVVIPGSKNAEHIKDNMDIFDFALTDEEMEQIAKLDKNERYYHRTDEQLVQFANWKPEFEK